MNTSTKHFVWANKKFFEALSILDETDLALAPGEGEWSIAEHLAHIGGALEWFRYILNRSKWTDIHAPTTIAELAKLGEYINELGVELIAESEKASDEVIEFEDERGPHRTTRPVVMAQAALHCAEHKVEIVTILRKHKRLRIDLEQFDVWHSPFAEASH